MKFDIVNFYPSISEELLSKAINFAKSSCEISDRYCLTIVQFGRNKRVSLTLLWVATTAQRRAISWTLPAQQAHQHYPC